MLRGWVLDTLSKVWKGVVPKKLTCPHCGKVGGGSVMYNHHFDNCPSIGGTKKKVAMNEMKLKCPHCDKEGTVGGMKRWHFDNCKLRNQM